MHDVRASTEQMGVNVTRVSCLWSLFRLDASEFGCEGEPSAHATQNETKNYAATHGNSLLRTMQVHNRWMKFFRFLIGVILPMSASQFAIQSASGSNCECWPVVQRANH